jgi:pSer/pThr/pTyr-binding forkhead associated (FHA) protein
MQEPENVATGRAVILEIVRAMRENLEPLVFSTIAPARFYVYLHPNDHKRLEGIFPLVVEQAKRALDEEVKRANEKSAADKLRNWLSKDTPAPPIEPPREGWDIRFEPDLDGEMQPGDIAVASELFLPAPAEFAGSRTRRVTTMQSGGKTSRREQVVDMPVGAGASASERAATSLPASSEGTVFATLTYQDQQGLHRFSMTKNEIVIGRGGIGYWVDVKLQTSADVSREHIRVRRDRASGRFYVKDLSTLGTTIDGQAVASSVEVVDGNKRDKGIEVPLPPHARIGLAGLVFLQFDSGGAA